MYANILMIDVFKYLFQNQIYLHKTENASINSTSHILSQVVGKIVGAKVISFHLLKMYFIKQVL